MTTKRVEICIIGGGIQGCSAALELAKRGHDVAVVERDYPGRQSSGVNAGGVRRLNRDLAEVPLSVAAHKIWENIEEHVGDSCGFKQSANINVCSKPDQLDRAKARVKTTTALGYSHERIISADEVREYLPKLEGQVTGALQGVGDGYASPFRTTQAYYRAAQRHGAKFYLGHGVESVQRNKNWIVHTTNQMFEAETILNCAGAWGNLVAKAVGDPTPVHSEAPMMSITAPVPPLTDAVVSFFGRRLSFKQRENNTLLIGGGYRGYVNPDGRSSRLSIPKLAENAQAVLDLFPHLSNVPIVRSWAGVEGMTPDHIPIISPSLNESNLLHAFGFSSHGFQLGPIIGPILADLVETGKTNMPIDPFHIKRFS